MSETTLRSRLLNAAELRDIVKEAAEDPGGSGYPPRLYDLIQNCLSPTSENYRARVVTALIEYFATFFGKASAAEKVMVNLLLSRGELILDSPRLQSTLVSLVTKSVSSLSKDTAD